MITKQELLNKSYKYYVDKSLSTVTKIYDSATSVTKDM